MALDKSMLKNGVSKFKECQCLYLLVIDIHFPLDLHGEKLTQYLTKFKPEKIVWVFLWLSLEATKCTKILLAQTILRITFAFVSEHILFNSIFKTFKPVSCVPESDPAPDTFQSACTGIMFCLAYIHSNQ